MNHLQWLRLIPLTLSIAFAGQTIATASEISNDAPLAQVTSVSQLSDVQPTDWAYQALQSLVERYGCIAGYPDGTYRGNRALTRYEFAAGLNACLDRINELIAASTADALTRQDLAILERLQQEFTTELATLRNRVDSLEAQAAELEANQFSTTTKLNAETIFFVSDLFGGDEFGEINQTVAQYRTRLNFDTSFTGRDILRTRLQAGNIVAFEQPGTELIYGAAANSQSGVIIDSLRYQFLVNERIQVGLFANGAGIDEIAFANTINPLDNSGRAALTRFGQRNAVYRTGITIGGIGTTIAFTDNIGIQAGYLSGAPAIPEEGNGLFNGDYTALGQLTVKNLFNFLDLGLTYVNAYTGTTTSATGDIIAGVPFNMGSRLARVDADRPVIANSYGVTTNLRLFEGFQLGGWAGFSAVRVIGLGDADVWNYAVTLTFPDLGGEGNLGGIILGIQPRLTGTTPALGGVLGQRRDPDVGYHIEAFYRLALNDNIDITPGVVWLTAPNHDNDNEDIVLGTIRTTFRF